MGHTHHHHAPGANQGSERYARIRFITVLGAWIDLLLGIAKIIVGYIANSQALIADGIHSLSDLATDFMVLYAAKHADRKADDEHPYGHGRIETIATVGLGIALMLVAIGIVYEAVQRLLDASHLSHPGILALVITVISIVAKEAIFQYTMRVARELKSNMLRANAWHSRTDAISSVVVLVGLIGTMFGYLYLDAVAAIAVGLMIGKIAWDLSWHSVRELIDTALDANEVAAIKEAIESVPGVNDCHMLRTRRSGGDVLVDVHIQVSPTLSVSEGHQIGEQVRTLLINRDDEVNDVTVHIDPEDDEEGSPSRNLPLREEILDELTRVWADRLPLGECTDITLHYMKGRVNVDVVLPLERAVSREIVASLTQALQDAASEVTHGGRVRLYFTDAPN